jgi:ribosomal protein S18 acetylase RimI-like enzyme
MTDDLGVEAIDLHVRRDNPAALQFWQAQGFMIGHYQLKQYRDPEKRVGFVGALSSDFTEEN